MGIILGSGSFRGRDHFGVDLRVISGLGIISGSGSFRGLYRPLESYENRENYYIYENCVIYDDSLATYQIDEIYSKCCKEGPTKVTKITLFTRTAKVTIIRNSLSKINQIYSKSGREGPSKVTRIAKITKLTKTAKFTIIRHTSCKRVAGKAQRKLRKLRYLRKLRNLR